MVREKCLSSLSGVAQSSVSVTTSDRQCDSVTWQFLETLGLCFPHHQFKWFFVMNIMKLSEWIHWESFLCNNCIKNAKSVCSPYQKWPFRVYRTYLLNHNTYEHVLQTHFALNLILNRLIRAEFLFSSFLARYTLKIGNLTRLGALNKKYVLIKL